MYLLTRRNRVTVAFRLGHDVGVGVVKNVESCTVGVLVVGVKKTYFAVAFPYDSGWLLISAIT